MSKEEKSQIKSLLLSSNALNKTHYYDASKLLEFHSHSPLHLLVCAQTEFICPQNECWKVVRPLGKIDDFSHPN